ncbi:outer membrane protein assembly factor BamB family protein [Mariniblastus fucicola]|uniref:Outer membrane biogenesis protein BamB n=1 Tax=Mariniblastus fucicola TaxID=980251 RepID=A0A5B9PHP2_9BACT|nr:PQQ-binding-like beta-propeller repeat protein [Mariniblastus fucicola]QEG24182.1 outer membrane biogenesis protein BamB [Mariniblastus fucicola]
MNVVSRFCFLLIVVLAQPVWGQSWMQFRGNAANPVSESQNVATKWSATENIQWKTEIEGRGWSSPIVVDDRVFVTTAVNENETKPPQAGTNYSNAYVAELMKEGLSQEEVEKRVMERDFELPDSVNLHCFLVCLDLNSGKELWRHEYHTGKPPGGMHRKNSFASETPLSDGNHVFVYATHVGLYAYTLDGKQVWNTSLENHPIYMEFGTGTSPVLLDEKIIILDDNEEASSIAAYNKTDGSQIWKTQRSGPASKPAASASGPPAGMPKSGWATPYVWKTPERTEIVTVGPSLAVSYDESGNELWRMKGMTPAPSASSFAFGDFLLLNGGKMQPVYAIRPGAQGDITLEKGTLKSEFVEWSRPRAGTYIPTPVAHDGGLYVLQDNGILQRYDTSTGEQSYKKRIKSSGADFTSSPWVMGDKLFCLSEQGDTYVLKTGSEYELLHTNSLGEFCMASPAVAGDRLILRTESAIYSIAKQ